MDYLRWKQITSKSIFYSILTTVKLTTVKLKYTVKYQVDNQNYACFSIILHPSSHIFEEFADYKALERIENISFS